MFQDAATFNDELTILAQGFMAQRKDSLIDWVAPYVATGCASGTFKLFDQDDPFQLYDTSLPSEGESLTVHFNATDANYSCMPHGLKIPITDWERKQAGEAGYEVMRQGKLNTLLSTQLVNRELQGWRKIFVNVSPEENKGVWRGSAGAGADPIDELDDLIEQINNNTGAMPKAIAMGLSAWRTLKNHANVRARLSGIKASASVEDIRGMLINPEVEIKVGSMPYKSGVLGKKTKNKGIIGSDLFVFHRSDSPTTEDMSAFKTFSVEGTGLAEIHTIPDEKAHKTYDEVLWSEDLKVCAPIAVKRITVS